MKLPKLRTTLLFLGLIILVSLIILNFNYFEKTISSFIESRLITWGYIGFFFFVFLLEAIPQPFLSALILLVSGSLLGLNFIILFWLTLLSSILANYTAYFLGLSLKESAINLLISENSYRKYLSWFEKYSRKSITILALTPFLYFPIIGGIFKMKLSEFTKYAVIPRIIHFLIFSGILILSI